MAFMTVKYCADCKKETQHCNGICLVCHERFELERITVWNSLTTDEKLNDIRKRVEKLERGPILY
jgi:hypothetical protein